MLIIAKCPICKNPYEAGPDKADKRVRCPKCRRLFKIPDLNSLEKALEIIHNASGTVYVDQNGRIYA